MADRKGGDRGGRERSRGSSNRGGKPLAQQDICVGEELKIAVNVAVDRFRSNELEKELEFPSSLTANERAYVHRYCQDLGLISKSKGKGNKRYLTVYKIEEENMSVKSKFSMTKSSELSLSVLLNSYPVSSRDRHELSGQKLHKGIVTEQSKILARENRLVLGNNPQVPPEARETEVGKSSTKLPIYSFKDEIIKAINENQVIMVAGDTGSGKTTQVGKFILEDHHNSKTACRIICTQPRRISAISVSERVAAERGERIGQTVGYQVRLDSKLSPKTLLHFCTSGVLLRLLMVGHKCLANITHVIVDEIHERDIFSDYLLISLKDLLKTYKKLKVILMSATLNIDLFKTYFGTCPIINVPGDCYEVKSYFLEDVLRQTSYINKGMRKVLQDTDAALFQEDEEVLPKQSTAADDVMKMLKKDSLTSEEIDSKHEEGNDGSVVSEHEKEEEKEDGKEEDSAEEDYGEDVEIESDSDIERSDDKEEIDDLKDDVEKLHIDDSDEQQSASNEMDSFLAQAWLNGDDEAFDQIIHLILNENVPVDYQHSETMMTSLIVASARGNLLLTEQLIELGAKIDIEDPKNNRNALDWAKHFNQDSVAEYLQGLMSESKNTSNETSNDTINEELDENDQRRLELYHKSFDDQRVDISLIISLLRTICKDTAEDKQGAVLIFLPGYDEIMSLRDRLINDKDFSKRSDYQILMLHSMLPPSNQRRVFSKPPKGVRKLILSTNIAETSVTIEDVVYVIDSGKVKEKSHDAVSSVSTLRTVWISKASAIQRRGRAGRCAPGVCYHLFSQERFHHFSAYQDAEILRVPLHELCLQTKMLAPVNISISNYLAKAPEPPSNLMVRNAVRLLKAISALDDNEDMTDLGKLLVEFPIDPQLGKMILLGMTLKCLEPAIVIACCSSYKEPFVLPTVASHKSQANVVKSKFSSDSHSDQIAMLRAFQGWQRAKREGREKVFCFKNFISPGTMEMVGGMRRQLLSQLRNLGLVRSRGPGDIKDLNSNSRNWAVVKAVVGGGLYPNIVKVDRDNLFLVSEKEKKVNIHNSSVVIARNDDKVQSTVSRASKLKSVVTNLPFDWLTYEELSRLYYSVQIRSVTVLSPVATALTAGPCLSYDHSCLRLKSGRDRKGKRSDKSKETLFQESDSEQEDRSDTELSATFKIDDWISFTGEDSSLYSIAMLRIKFLALFTKHIQIPGKSWNVADDAIVQCITNILTKEEQAVGITNPATKDIEKRLSFERRNERYNQRGSYESSRGGYHRGGYRGGDYSRRGGGGEYRGAPRHERYRNNTAREEKDSDQNETLNESEDDDLNRSRGSQQAQREASYFIMKCNNEKNMGISFERNIWATTKGNEKRLRHAYNTCDEVFLIFSIQGSGHFQGVAKMITTITDNQCEDFGSANLGGVFEIDWIYKEEIPFQFTQHLTNPWNDNKKVQISRDAQEVEPSVGEALVQLWEHVPDSPKDQQPDVLSPDEKEPEEEHSNDFYPEPVYGESDQAYMEGYPLYSPPPFSPQFLPEFVPQHHFAPAPPPPHMAYQQPYPSYPPHDQVPPYRQQLYYPVAPQYAGPRRGNPHDMYNRNGHYNRSENRNRGGGYRP